MKRIDPKEAQTLLMDVGLVIGEWARVGDLDNEAMKGRYSVNLRVPTEAQASFVFSMHLAQWVPAQKGILICFDNSTFLSKSEELLWNSFFSEIEAETYFPVLFESDNQPSGQALAQLSHLIFLLILFQAHAQVISFGSAQGEMIHIEDGSVFLSSRETVQFARDAWLENSDRTPLELPEWAM